MLKTPLQIAVSFAFLALIVKLSIFYFGVQHTPAHRYYVFFLMLLSILVAHLSIQTKTKEGDSVDFFEKVKVGSRGAIIFTLLLTVITYAYYSNIDTEFFEVRKAQNIEVFKENIGAYIQEHGLEKGREYLKGKIAGMGYFLNPKAQAMLTMSGFVFMGILNAFLLSLLQAFLFRKRMVPVNSVG